MIAKKSLLFLILGLALSGCRIDDTLCEAADCIAPVVTLKIKLVDKVSNVNLLSRNSSFKLSDLTITSTAYSSNLALKIDSTELNNRYVTILSSGTETFTVKYKDSAPDQIDIRSKLVKSGCCKILNVQSITLNGNPVCPKCSGVEVIEIRK
ncbi:hypothetical protein B0I27_10315 [Arcticibacter pallidicorallinus]|uniref:Uncharacterized protein n=1 Tax=Arcticibacter pallidicorallinus TaxID=1259464 RepID=A0A2T0U6L1_9SPHI|nr:hypothetical protein [Arcticibacter pallidicorallinus]PRY53550.1 hypothetical protein B0I27_10315 [Arcticibacter pallidicorallinus]